MARRPRVVAGRRNLAQLNIVIPEQLMIDFNQYCISHGLVRGALVEGLLIRFLESGGKENPWDAISPDVQDDLRAFSRVHYDAPIAGLLAKAISEFIDREVAGDARTAKALGKARNQRLRRSDPQKNEKKRAGVA
jgi:hypothetical protein